MQTILRDFLRPRLVNTIGACTRCNGAKRDRPLLDFLRTRAHAQKVTEETWCS